MTRKEMMKKAIELGITGTSKMNMEDIEKAIKTVEAEVDKADSASLKELMGVSADETTEEVPVDEPEKLPEPEILDATEELPESLGGPKGAFHIEVPTRYKHSGRGRFQIENRVLEAGESFTPDEEELENPRFLKKFNRAIELEILVKA